MDGRPQPPPPPPNPNPNPLLSAIADLRSLLSLANHTLSSSPFPPSTATPLLLRCPCNPNHRVPADSLFSHFLRCLGLDSALLPALPPPPLPVADAAGDRLPAPPPDSNLCFSLDTAAPTASASFFLYGDCPAVISTPELSCVPEGSFSLPGYLTSECSDYVPADSGSGSGGLSWLLPSELWMLKCEMVSWGDQLPRLCSYAGLRAASRLDECVVDGDYGKWVVAMSANFGVVIDSIVRVHLCVLARLCFKAVAREAQVELENLQRREELLDRTKVAVMCPRMIGAMSWLGIQLAILYGAANGRAFAVEMLKKAILSSGLSMLVKFKDDESSKTGAVAAAECGTVDTVLIGGKLCAENHKEDALYVSQVAAAIAALHQRLALERRIRAVHSRQQALPKSQLMREYLDAIQRGSEERLKRPNYRPIVEYDSIFNHRAQNQESNKTKTKEELLAEERDYKRRRMSYRGKKVKRNPTEVLRDIIDEHMELIKNSGVIGTFGKNPLETAHSFQLSTSQNDTDHELWGNTHGISEEEPDQINKKSSDSSHIEPSRNTALRNHATVFSPAQSRSRYDDNLEYSMHRRYGNTNKYSERRKDHSHIRENWRNERDSSDQKSSFNYYKHSSYDSQNSKYEAARSSVMLKSSRSKHYYTSDEKQRERDSGMHGSELTADDPLLDRFDPSTF